MHKEQSETITRARVHALSVRFFITQPLRKRPVTKMAETWFGDSGHPKNMLEKIFLGFVSIKVDLDHFLAKKAEKFSNRFLAITFLQVDL